MKKSVLEAAELTVATVVEDTSAETAVRRPGKGFTAKVSQVDFINRNRRIYPMAEMQIAVDNFNRKLQEPDIYGYPEPGLVNHPLPEMGKSVGAIGVKWEKLWFEGNNLMARGRTVETQVGKDITALMEAGIPVGFSSRASAETEEVETPEGKATRMKNIDLITFDVVVDPSFHTARVQALHEATEPVIEENKEEVMQLEELVKQVTALQEAAAQREAELAKLTEKFAVMEAETRQNALLNRLRELTEGHRFAETIISEAVAMGVTFEQSEQVVSRLKALTESIAAASASGIPAGRGAAETPEAEVATEAAAAAPEVNVSELLEGTGLL